MERPSHIAFSRSQPASRRLVSLGLAVSFPLLVIWAMVTGLTGHKGWDAGPLIYVPVEKKVEPRTPPIEPTIKEPEKIVVLNPIIPPYEQERPGGGITASADRAPPQPPAPPAAGPDRAAVAIASTHTLPPYPMLARRVNAEGTVTLRLTVLTDGRVGMAEIVTSSGRADLDEAARDWIVRHWTYRPALDKGQPVIGHVVASVRFQLTNER